jgi:hypothetical protein
VLAEMLWRPHERPLRWEALRMQRKGFKLETDLLKWMD